MFVFVLGGFFCFVFWFDKTLLVRVKGKKIHPVAQAESIKFFTSWTFLGNIYNDFKDWIFTLLKVYIEVMKDY